jgi:hypothetical protein
MGPGMVSQTGGPQLTMLCREKYVQLVRMRPDRIEHIQAQQIAHRRPAPGDDVFLETE